MDSPSPLVVVGAGDTVGGGLVRTAHNQYTERHIYKYIRMYTHMYIARRKNR